MSPAARSFDAEGASSDLELAPELFDVQVNVPVMHEAVRAQLAAARAGTHSTKTRGEVRGGGRKPWRQKGTGRARHGSIREPQWVGGGVAHGPKPRDHSFRFNRKTRSLALRSALTDRAREGKVIVVEIPDFENPNTKEAIELLERWGAEGKTLIVASRSEEESLDKAWKSFRNLPEVLMVTYPTTYTVLAADTIVFTRPALEALSAEKPATPEASAGSSAGSGSIPEANESRKAPSSVPDDRSPSVTGRSPASASESSPGIAETETLAEVSTAGEEPDASGSDDSSGSEDGPEEVSE